LRCDELACLGWCAEQAGDRRRQYQHRGEKGAGKGSDEEEVIEDDDEAIEGAGLEQGGEGSTLSKSRKRVSEHAPEDMLADHAGKMDDAHGAEEQPVER